MNHGSPELDLLQTFERLPMPLLRPLEVTAQLRLQRSARGLCRLLPQKLVRSISAARFSAGDFKSPWLPGARMVTALNRCQEEDVDACFAMLASSGDSRPEDGALHMAAVRNFLSTMKLLLCCRGDPQLRCSAGLTVLDSAINAGTVAAAHLLLDHGAGTSQPQDALLVAAGSRCLDSLAPRLIKECSADVDGAIDLAVENEDATVVMQLVQLPTAKQRKWVKQWLLRRAAVNGDTTLLEGTLALPGVDLDDGVESSVGPALLLAAEGGHAAVCQRLLQKRADLQRAARTGLRGRWTATDVAQMHSSRPEFQEVLLVLSYFDKTGTAGTAGTGPPRPATERQEASEALPKVQ